MDPPTATNYIIGEVLGDGDSFFNSVAQCLEQVREDKFSEKKLRQECKRYAQHCAVLQNAIGGQKTNDYMREVTYCANESQNAIEGRPEIEGRIISNFFEVRIHVIEKKHFNNTYLKKTSGQMIFQYPDNIYIIKEGDTSFKPVLKMITEISSDKRGRKRNEINDGDQEDKLEIYDKRPGTSGVGGQFYEIKLSTLAFISLQAADKFRLASNMLKAGAFDDVVFQYHINKDGANIIKTVFLQAKHTEKGEQGIIRRTDLISSDTKNPFRLKKYLDSYQTIKSHFEKGEGLIFNEKFEDCRFIMFTNYNLKQNSENGEKSIDDPDRWITNVAADGIIIIERMQSKLLKTRTTDNQDIIDALCGKYWLKLNLQNIYKLATELAKQIGDCDQIIVKIDNPPKGIMQLANSVLVRDEAASNKNNIVKFRTGALEPKAKIFMDALIAQLKKYKAKKARDPSKIRFEIQGFPRIGPEEHVAEHEVKEFLSKFEFLVGQKNESELNDIIKTTITEEFHPQKHEDVEIIYQSVRNDVESWWKHDKHFLTQKNKFIQNILDRIAHVYLSARDKLKKRGIEITGVRFSDDAVAALLTTIGRKQVLNVVAEEGATILSIVKMCQNLDEKHKKKGYIFTDTNELLNLQDQHLQAFQSNKKFNVLLIESNKNLWTKGKWSKGTIEELQSRLKSIINKDPKKNIVLISEQNDQLANYFENDSENFHKVYDTIHFNDLTGPSQDKMMDSEVKLHGKMTQMKDVIDIKNENASKAITTKMLMSFINNDKLSISNELQCLNDLEAAFAKLQYEIPMENLVRELLASFENKTMFVISGINKPNRGNELSDELLHCLRIEDENVQRNIKQKFDDKTIIIIPNQNNAQSLTAFQYICSTTTLKKKIYWVKVTSEHACFKQVYDPSYYIQRKFNYKQTVVLKLELILHKNASALFIFNDVCDQEKVEKLVDSLQDNYLLHLETNCNNGTIIFANSIFEATRHFAHLMAKTKNVHWLEINESSKTQFRWRRSHGTLPDMKKDHMGFQLDLLVQENSPYVFIFSDEAAKQNVKDMIIASCEAKQQQFVDNCKKGVVTFSPTNIADENIDQHKQTKESRHVHWLKIGGRDNELLIWEKSRGSLESLRKFIGKTEQCSYTEKQFVKEFRDKAVIIADEPGMGKTTSLTSVSQEMLDTNWVIRINFLDCKLAIEKLPTKQAVLTFEGVYNFLSCVDKGLDNDSTKQLLLCKLDPKQTHCRPILILFDGFDEIREKEQPKVILLLECIMQKTSAKMWITTRLHKLDTLENSLLVFATEFKEIEKPAQKTFLKRFWKVRLGSMSKHNIDKKLEKYSSGLLNNVEHILGQNISRVMGIPLQLRLLGEALKNDVANYLNEMVDMEPNFENVNTLYVYQQFIKEKYEIFVKDKMRIENNDPSMIDAVLRDIAEKHAMYAIRLLFSEDDSLLVGNRVRKEHENYVNSVGIIQSIGENNSPHFIHRTFAEYFVAESLVNNLDEDNPIRHKSTKQFLLKHMFQNNNQVIHNFIDRLLAKRSPIHVAILDNKVQDIFESAKEKTHAIHVDNLGRTSLHLAAQEGVFNVVNILLEYGYDTVIPTQDALGRTALHYAVTNGNATAVNIILHHITDTDLNSIFAIPLHTDMEIGDSLFQNPEHLNSMQVKFVNTKDDSGTTSFQYSIQIDRGIACTLLIYGANLDIVSAAKKLELSKYFTYHCGNNLNNVINGLRWLSILGLLLIKWPITTQIAIKSEAWEEILGRFINYGHTKVIEAIMQNLADEEDIESLLSCNTKISYTFPLSDEDHLKVAQYFLEECKNKSWISTFAQTSAHNGNLNTLKYVIEKEQAIDYSVYMLHAIRENQLNIVTHLYQNYSQYINDYKGDTALHLAAKYDRLEIVKYFVNNGADVNARNSIGKMPVQYAVEFYAAAVITYLTNHGANISAKLEHCIQYAQICATFWDANVHTDVLSHFNNLAAVCPNMAGIIKDYDQVANIIISQVHKDVNFRNEQGTALLHISATFQTQSLAKYLIKHGADVNIKDEEGRTPLHKAVQAYCHKGLNNETVIYLLACGAVYDEKDNSGKTVFDYFHDKNIECDILLNIIDKGFKNFDNLLQEYTCESKEWIKAINNARNSDGSTLLHLAAMSSLETFENSFKFDNSNLKWHNCFRISYNEEGNSPLHLAAANGRVQNVIKLIRYGCPFNSRNKQYHTPADLAHNNGHTDIDELLQSIEKTFTAVKENKRCEIEREICEKCPNVTDNDGKTMLHWAAGNGQVDIATLLIQKNANIEAKDNHGCKPLHFAAQNDQFKIVQLLLYHCAIFNPRNKEGKTPLEVAIGTSKIFLEQVNAVYCHFQVGNLAIASECLKSMRQINSKAFNAAVRSCDNFKNTFLHYAAAGNDTELVQFLLENGAPFDARNKMMKYPIYLAHDKQIRKLLGFIEQMFEWIDPPIHDIVPVQKSPQTIILCRNSRDTSGNTILHASVESPVHHLSYVRIKFFHLLIQNGFDINAINKQGCTPLDLAIRHNNFDVIRFLLKEGGKTNDADDDDIQKMLQQAAADGRPDISHVCKSLQKL